MVTQPSRGADAVLYLLKKIYCQKIKQNKGKLCSMIDPLLTVLQEESDMVHQLQFFSVLNMVLGKFCKVFKKASNELTGRLSKSLVCTIKLGDGTRKVNTVLLKILRHYHFKLSRSLNCSTYKEEETISTRSWCTFATTSVYVCTIARSIGIQNLLNIFF